MDDKNRIKRANLTLIIIVVLFLLYGIFYRIQSGDKALYLFGYKIDLPFTTEQNAEPAQDSGSTLPD